MGELRSSERDAHLQEVKLQSLDCICVDQKRGLSGWRNVVLLTECKGDLSQQELSSFPRHLQNKLCPSFQVVQVSQECGCRQLGHRLMARHTDHREPHLHNQP